MRRVLATPGAWPLHQRAHSQRIEQASLGAVPAYTLMQRAGTATARLTRALRPHARSIWIAAGPGNNGGDGLEAALQLHQARFKVVVSLIADPQRLPTDARTAWQRATDAGVPFASRRIDDIDPDIAIDALLGLGGDRAPDELLAACIGHLNSLHCPVLAIDLPSGLHPDTGQPFGTACAKASHTLSLLTLKPGLFTGSGRELAGQVWFDGLQVDTSSEPADAWLGGRDFTIPTRSHVQHKGSFGDVAVVGGARGMTGAALLAARAAHAAGAGRVFVSLVDDASTTLDPERPELMFRPAWWQSAAATLRSTTVVCGCGAGDAVRLALPPLLSTAARLVLDADALNAVAGDASLQRLLQARRARQLETVLTPHPLEAARLLGTDAASVQADRLTAADTLARSFGCVVVLKGSGSVIAAPDKVPFINATGNAALATAGTGDVLAGWLGGCWAAQDGNAHDSARQAVWQHGHAADTSPDSPLRAADLIEALHRQRAR